MSALGVDSARDGACAAWVGPDGVETLQAADVREAWRKGCERYGALDGAVLTSAAGGSPGDRRSLLRQARQADIDVFRIISAPAAAALAHTLASGARGLFAVLDLRRSAFDCSLVSVEAERIEVLAGVGFADLGADAVDNALTEALRLEAGAEERERSTLRIHARRAREDLSDRFDTRLEIRLSSGGRIRRRLTRHEMARYAHQVRARWMAACRRAVAEARSHPAWIDGVLLLGHAPMLGKVVRRCFNRPATVLGAEASAIGAAQYAHLMLGNSGGPLVLERSTHGLALESRDGTRTPILPAGTPLPASVPCRPERGDRLVHLDWRDGTVAVEAIDPAVVRVMVDASGVVHAQ